MAQDLGHLLGPNPLTAGGSMAGGNTVSDRTEAMTAPGSPSESTMDTPVRVAVAAQLPPLRQPSTIVSGGQAASDAPWTRPQPQGGPWRQATDVTEASMQPRDSNGRWVQT